VNQKDNIEPGKLYVIFKKGKVTGALECEQSTGALAKAAVNKKRQGVPLFTLKGR